MISTVAQVAPLLRSFGLAPQTSLPTLSLVDHGDGSGATATIGDTDPASTNVVYVQPFEGNTNSGPWQPAGARMGNGSVELPLTAAHYFALVTSERLGASASSAVLYFAVSDGLESLSARILAAVQARIRLLLLSDMPDDHVVIHKVPLNRTASGAMLLPAIVLSPRQTAMPATEGTNSLDDVHYEVLAAIFDRDNQEPTLALGLDRHLLWRQQISRAFRNQRLPGVAEVINAEVEPAEGLLDAGWKNELMASALRLRFTCRETRGL